MKLTTCSFRNCRWTHCY